MCVNYKDITGKKKKEYKTHIKFVAVIDGVQLPDFQWPAILNPKALNLVVIKFPIGKPLSVFSEANLLSCLPIKN